MRVRLGEVAHRIGVRGDPRAEGIDRFVAGEHLRTDDLRVDYGQVTPEIPGPAFTTIFESGAVLYGTRRTYLRKVGVVDFKGVSANTTLALGVLGNQMMPDYLPWLMSGPSFVEFSVRESKGSVNPFINWSDIARFEFDLPSLDEQHRVVEVMRAVDREIEAAERAEVAAVVSIAALVSSLPESVASRRPLSEVLALRTSGAWGDSDESKKRSVKVRVITNGDIRQDGNISGFSTRWFSAREASRFTLSPGDVLMTASGDVGKTAMVGHELVQQADEPLAFSNFVHLLRPSASLSAVYLYAQTRYGSIQRDIERMSSGSVLANLNVDFYRRATIQVPDPLEMSSLESRIASLMHTESAARGAMQAARSLRTSLLQELIG